MNIPDSDLPTIRAALRESYNWNRNNARMEQGDMRAVYLRAAEKYKAALNRLKGLPPLRDVMDRIQQQ